VKLTARLLLTLPFALATFLYLRLRLSENGCWGLIELVYSIALWIFLALTFAISIVATLRKRQSQTFKAEPYSLTVTLVTLLTLLVGGIWGDNLKGKKWIEARSQNYNGQPTAQELTLRKNGTFTVYLREDDFTCYYSGDYRKVSDTVTFDSETIGKTDFKLTTQYLLKENVLYPLTNSVGNGKKFSKFDITWTK
jgi:hypothetical protein